MVLLTNESIVKSYELLSSSNEDIEAEKQFAIDLKNKLESFRGFLTKTTMKKLESLYKLRTSILEETPAIITELKSYEDIAKLNIYRSALNIVDELKGKAILLCKRSGDMTSLNIVGLNSNQSNCFPVFDYQDNNGKIEVNLYQQNQNNALRSRYLSELVCAQNFFTTEEFEVIKPGLKELKMPIDEDEAQYRLEIQQQFDQSFIEFHGIVADKDFRCKNQGYGVPLYYEYPECSALTKKLYSSSKVTVYAKTII